MAAVTRSRQGQLPRVASLLSGHPSSQPRLHVGRLQRQLRQQREMVLVVAVVVVSVVWEEENKGTYLRYWSTGFYATCRPLLGDWKMLSMVVTTGTEAGAACGWISKDSNQTSSDGAVLVQTLAVGACSLSPRLSNTILIRCGTTVMQPPPLTDN